MTPKTLSFGFAVILAVAQAAAGVRAQSDLYLPGALQAAITPPEAAARGAGFSVAGRPPKAPGTTETGLVPGRAVVQFSRIPGWAEPAPQEVLLVGGEVQSVAAEYTPLPEYYFRAIPDQTARHGAALRFRVRSSDPDDPESPSSGAALTMKVAPKPVGAVTFDAATRGCGFRKFWPPQFRKFWPGSPGRRPVETLPRRRASTAPAPSVSIQ